MALWRLKKREEITIHQTKPLIFRRIDDRWTLVGERQGQEEREVSYVNEDEEQPEYG
ncbi:MAG TPA: hypothetical protein VJ944_04720 [Thermoplasmataceae archaeon]|nr:hypothetical protein [Thermoplasmataceae archaeon]